MDVLSTLIASLLLSAGSIPLLSRLALRCHLVDIPDERKVHSRPIPRVGGIAIALGAFAPLVFWGGGDDFVRHYLLSALVLVLFGLADDRYGLSPFWKLVGQTLAAALMIGLGGLQIVTLGSLIPETVPLPSWLWTALTILAVVGVTNAINLADGLDGLAGGIALLCLAASALLAWQQGDANLGLIAVALGGAVFGFLRYNTFPATIFMGDAGSQLLGFSAVTLALALTQRHSPVSPVVPLLILGLPVLDTLTVMVRRLVRRRSPFVADRTHLHHNLLALGLHHSESVLVIYVLQVLLTLVAYQFRFHSDWLLLGGYLLFSAALLLLLALARRPSLEPGRLRLLARLRSPLRLLREETPLLCCLFGSFSLLYPALLLLTSACTGPPSAPLALAALLALVLIGLVRLLLPQRLATLLYCGTYLLVPFGVYLSAEWLAGQPPGLGHWYNAIFGLVALLFVLVSKLSRRRGGFTSTPLDFLICFLTAAPLLADASTPQHHLGLVAAKVLILYYGFEVLMAELRGSFAVVAGGLSAALALPVLQWVVRP